MGDAKETGSVGWVDLTVPAADQVRDFYKSVVGWDSEGLPMKDQGEGYEDYVMKAPGSGDGVAGICYARGQNVGIPPVWLIYIMVKNLDESIAKCTELGGSVIHGPRNMGKARFCVIQDPAGAKAGLFDPGPQES